MGACRVVVGRRRQEARVHVVAGLAALSLSTYSTAPRQLSATSEPYQSRTWDIATTMEAKLAGSAMDVISVLSNVRLPGVSAREVAESPRRSRAPGPALDLWPEVRGYRACVTNENPSRSPSKLERRRPSSGRSPLNDFPITLVGTKPSTSVLTDLSWFLDDIRVAFREGRGGSRGAAQPAPSASWLRAHVHGRNGLPERRSVFRRQPWPPPCSSRLGFASLGSRLCRSRSRSPARDECVQRRLVTTGAPVRTGDAFRSRRDCTPVRRLSSRVRQLGLVAGVRGGWPDCPSTRTSSLRSYSRATLHFSCTRLGRGLAPMAAPPVSRSSSRFRLSTSC